MTLDETIKHYEEVAESCERGNPKKRSKMECAKEHRQRAEWLRELKAYREILENADKIIKSEYGCVIIEGYADIIDKMNEVYKESDSE